MPLSLPKPKAQKMRQLIPHTTPAEMAQQLGEKRRTVDFDSFDIQLQQLLSMLEEGQIWVAPAYQRQFRWDDARCSELIESLMLGIPIPNLFMATNPDSTWEVVDGLQRLSSIAKFAGSAKLREKLGLGAPLVLEGLRKLDKFKGETFESLPPSIQQHIRTRPLKVVTLNDKSDTVVRFDLFERLNTGGISLTQQEIRACVYSGQFADLLEKLSKTTDFKTVVRLTDKQKADGTAEECVLRFFAYRDEYLTFDHSVTNFLNNYMKKSKENGFDLEEGEQEFTKTLKQLAPIFPQGIMRPQRKGRTPLNLFEAIAVGAALALKERENIATAGVNEWVASNELRKVTGAGSNDRVAVRGRIEFCRDRFLGVPYVRAADDGS